tara:strand:- start:1243 stop:2823 length:1581 start_codon:yes stop_codon:yes gene_type:complete
LKKYFSSISNNIFFNQMILSKNHISIIILLFISYCSIGTGIHTDDYIFLADAINNNFNQSINSWFANRYYFLSAPNIFFQIIQAHLFHDNYFLYDIIKILVICLSIYFVYLFSTIYMNSAKSILFSFCFVIYPINEAVNYQPITMYYLIVPALVMYGFYNINFNKYLIGVCSLILGTFFSYGSLPYVFGLSILFLFQKQYKNFSIFIFPQLIYIIYYFIISINFNVMDTRTGSIFNFSAIIKQFMIQLFSSIDSLVGPSFILKMLLSISSLSLISALIGIAFIVLFIKNFQPIKNGIESELLYSFTAILFIGYFIYSLTGLLPNMSFGLGNRVTTYGVLLSSLIIVSIFFNKKLSTILFSIIVFGFLGISDHWKNFENHKKLLMNKIHLNDQINSLEKNTQILISHNMYSKIGPISHIELFTESAPNNAIFNIINGKNLSVIPINSRCYVNGNNLIDPKFGIISNLNNIIVYNSNEDRLIKLNKIEIQNYINTLNEDKRHWIQFLPKNNFIRKLLIYLMPRFDYLF